MLKLQTFCESARHCLIGEYDVTTITVPYPSESKYDVIF